MLVSKLAGLKISNNGEIMLHSSHFMVPMVIQIEYLTLFNSLMLILEIHHMFMYLQNSRCQWLATMQSQRIEPKTWKACIRDTMSQLLIDEANDDVPLTCLGLKLEKGDTIQMYVDIFWDSHIKATIFKRIMFSEKGH